MNDQKFKLILATGVLLATLAVAGCGRTDSHAYVASAEGYIAKADYKAAIIELKNALNESPDDPRARFLLAKALQESGEPVAAETEFRKAISLKYPPDEVYPLLARALNQRGAGRRELLELASAPVQGAPAKAELAVALAVAYAGEGDYKEARAAIASAQSLEPANVNARVLEARIDAMEKNYPAAIAKVDQVLAQAPADVEALMLKADLESMHGRREESNKIYQRVVELQPQNARARFALVNGYFLAKDLDRAKAELEAVKKFAPDDARTLHAEAYLALARGDTAVAVDAVQKSIQAAPAFLPAHYLSGIIDFKRGAYATAEQSLRLVVAKSPEDDGARMALAETYLRRDQPAKAQETIDPVLRRSPDNPLALRLAGEIQLARKNPKGSTELITRANAIEKDNVVGRVRLAEVRMAAGDTGSGVKELEALVAAEPDTRDADVALITAHLRAREFDKALAAADALARKQPSSAPAQNLRGVVFMMRGDYKNARSAFEKALALDPRSISADFNLARIDVVQRKYADAQKRYDKLVEADPKSERALLGIAELKIASEAPATEVNAALQRAISINPNSVVARLALINYNARRKDWKTALTAAQAAQAAIPDTPQILEALATAHQASGDMNQAIEIYSRLARFQPDNPLPHMRIAGIQAGLKNYPATLAALRTAVDMAPDNPTLWVASGAAYAEANQFEAGFAEARRLQKAFTGKPVGWALEGELLVAQKKIPEAVTAYRAAMARQPVPFTAIRLHSLLLMAGKPEEAAVVGQKWLREHPKDVAVRAYLAQQSLAKGDHKTAAPLFRAAVEQEPENVLLLNNLAWSLSELNDPKALEYAERALALAPSVAEVVNTYGWILVQRGDSARGIEYLRRAVELAPTDQSKRLRLGMALIKTGDRAGARKELEAVVGAGDSPSRVQAETLLKTI